MIKSGIYVSQASALLAGQYDEEVLADGPVLYWKLDELIGPTAVDSSGNGYDGTYSGGPSFNQPSIVYGEPTAVFFDGSDDIVEGAPVVPLQILTDVTLEAWVKIPSVNATNGDTLACGAPGETPETNFAYALSINGSAQVRYFHEYGSGANTTLLFDYFLEPEKVYHLVVTRDTTAKSVSLYVNGAFRETLTYSTNPDGATSGYVKSVAPSSGATHDELAIYDKQLTHARIMAHWEAGFGPSADPYFEHVILLAPMDEQHPGTQWRDWSVFEQDITPVGGPVITNAVQHFGRDMTFFDGNAARLDIPEQDIHDYLGKVFCIEAFVRISDFTNVTGFNQAIVASSRNVSGGIQSLFVMTDGTIRFLRGSAISSTVLDFQSAAGLVELNTTYHVALTHDGDIMRIFLDGIQVASAADTLGWVEGAADRFMIGDHHRTSHSAFDYPFHGYMSQVRITAGVPRYTNNFAVPAEPHPVPLNPLHLTQANFYAVRNNSDGMRLSQANAYSVRNNSDGMRLEQANFYAVRNNSDGMRMSQANVYAIIQ